MAIGAFVMLTIAGIAYLIKIAVADLLLGLQTDPTAIYWISEVTALCVFVAVSLFTLHYYSKRHAVIVKNLFRYLCIAIGLYVLVQTLQYLYVVLEFHFFIPANTQNITAYNDFIESKPLFGVYSQVLLYLMYLLFGIFAYLKARGVED